MSFGDEWFSTIDRHHHINRVHWQKARLPLVRNIFILANEKEENELAISVAQILNPELLVSHSPLLQAARR